jgi:8-oxo-dGTP diphosphatase
MKLATLCYVKRNGKTLMLHRVKKENDMHEGKWNGLGGKLEPGETPEECVIREVEEESGLRLRRPRLHGIITFPSFDGVDDWYTYLFTATQFDGELIDSPEGKLAWIDDADLLDLYLWPGDRIFIPWLQQDRFFSAKFVYENKELRRHEVVFYGADGSVQAESADHGPAGLSPAASSLLTSAPTHADPSATPSGGNGVEFKPAYLPEDDSYCWMCQGPVVKRQCRIICQVCGFTRDCSDP